MDQHQEMAAPLAGRALFTALCKAAEALLSLADPLWDGSAALARAAAGGNAQVREVDLGRRLAVPGRALFFGRAGAGGRVVEKAFPLRLDLSKAPEELAAKESALCALVVNL